MDQLVDGAVCWRKFKHIIRNGSSMIAATTKAKENLENWSRYLVKSYLISIIRTEDAFKGAKAVKFTVKHSEYPLVSVLTYNIFHLPRPPESLFCKEVPNFASLRTRMF